MKIVLSLPKSTFNVDSRSSIDTISKEIKVFSSLNTQEKPYMKKVLISNAVKHSLSKLNINTLNLRNKR